MNAIDAEFIKKVEGDHFRTVGDTGAHPNAMMIWNRVRQHVGLARITIDDLPKYCETHDTYHMLREDYGCKQRTPVTREGGAE